MVAVIFAIPSQLEELPSIIELTHTQIDNAESEDAANLKTFGNIDSTSMRAHLISLLFFYLFWFY
jgi:hypothetical protein